MGKLAIPARWASNSTGYRDLCDSNSGSQTLFWSSFGQMRPLPHPSASPLPGYASRPFASRPVSFSEMLRSIIAWWCGVGPDWRQRHREAKVIEQLAEELAEADNKGTR
jgi:hypothetical protein